MAESQKPEKQEPQEGAQPAEDKKPTPKMGKLLVIGVLGLVLAGGGFFGFKFALGKSDEKSGPTVGKIIELEEFLVNLADEKTFLKAQIALGVKKGHKEEEIKEQLPRIRDAIIMVLTSKQPKQIATNAGKARLKKEILSAVNKLFKEEDSPQENDDSANKKTGSAGKAKDAETSPKSEPPKGPVVEVYFTSFATQRY
ncbi:MAG: flagellar basal body-associated FliL family protein [Candidatus Caldarchaeum sp.]